MLGFILQANGPSQLASMDGMYTGEFMTYKLFLGNNRLIFLFF